MWYSVFISKENNFGSANNVFKNKTPNQLRLSFCSLSLDSLHSSHGLSFVVSTLSVSHSPRLQSQVTLRLSLSLSLSLSHRRLSLSIVVVVSPSPSLSLSSVCVCASLYVCETVRQWDCVCVRLYLLAYFHSLSFFYHVHFFSIDFNQFLYQCYDNTNLIIDFKFRNIIG